MEVKVGTIVESRMGHDSGRTYIVMAVVDPMFVLLVDGKYHTLEKPKLKRVKHVKAIGESDVLARKGLTNAELYKVLKECRRVYAEGRQH